MAMFPPSPSVYVGNLDLQVNEPALYEHFKNMGTIVSVRVCLDSQTHKSLGYGYVNFQSPQEAERAIEQLSTTKLANKHIRVSKVQRDPTQRRNGISNIIIKHLPKTVDTPALKELFSKFGRITSTSIAVDGQNVSRGYAYVMFEREESAVTAVKEMNQCEIEEGKEIIVERYRPQHRQEQIERFTNLYVKNVDKAVTDDTFLQFFSDYGDVVSSKIRTDAQGQSMGFGFAAFSTHDAAARAVAELNEKPASISAEGLPLVVRRFQGHAERNKNRERQRRERQLAFSKYPNLYVKNFDDTVTSDKLKELFERYGSTVSVKVMFDPHTKLSRQFGFVSVVDQPTAAKCISELNGSTFLGPKPLFVAHAVKKDVRRQALEEQQKKARRPLFQGQMPPQMMPMYSPAMPPTMGRTNLPMQMQPQQHPMRPMVQQPGRGFGFLPNQGYTGDRPMQPARGFGGLTYPHTHPSMPVQPPAPQVSASPSLATILRDMTPEQQKNVLGERLYNHINANHPSSAAKVTGMLLEMDHDEILNLLENTDLLDGKIREALDVLQRHEGA